MGTLVALSALTLLLLVFFFFNDPAPTEIYPLPLHDALPISADPPIQVKSTRIKRVVQARRPPRPHRPPRLSHHLLHPLIPFRHYLKCPPFFSQSGDRKSTRLNSSHSQISYAVFCLKKKKNTH